MRQSVDAEKSDLTSEDRRDSFTQDDSTTPEERRLLHKVDRHVLPILTVLYLLSFLDRSNIANAKLDGLTTDLHISNENCLSFLLPIISRGVVD